jgi:Family of unknown function (DUF6152)
VPAPLRAFSIAAPRFGTVTASGSWGLPVRILAGWTFARRVIAAGAALLGTAAGAHHSPVAFDTLVTDFTLTGEIESVDVRNPHSVMDLRVANDDGSTTVWQIEFSSVNLLLRRGWDFDRLEVGKTVTCTGNPSALGMTEMYMWSIELDDGTKFGR